MNIEEHFEQYHNAVQRFDLWSKSAGADPVKKPPQIDAFRAIIEIIAPPQERFDDCANLLIDKLLNITIAIHTPRDSRATVRDRWIRASIALHGARIAIQELLAVRGPIWPEALSYGGGETDIFRNELKEMASRCDSLGKNLGAAADWIRVPKGQPRTPAAKKLSAQAAYHLLAVYGHRPSTTTGGPFFSLAEKIYEIAGGRRTASMEFACRKVLTQGGEIEKI